MIYVLDLVKGLVILSCPSVAWCVYEYHPLLVHEDVGSGDKARAKLRHFSLGSAFGWGLVDLKETVTHYRITWPSTRLSTESNGY